MAVDDPRYPIGPFAPVSSIDGPVRQTLIQTLEELPARLGAAVDGLAEAQLETPYRDGGWTVRQLVHHVADSHMNAFIRMRLAATEVDPPLKTYDQAAWAAQADSREAPLSASLSILDGLHARWCCWLRALPDDVFARTARHPEMGDVTIDTLLQMYAWHSRHHVAHITALREREDWGHR